MVSNGFPETFPIHNSVCSASIKFSSPPLYSSYFLKFFFFHHLFSCLKMQYIWRAKGNDTFFSAVGTASTSLTLTQFWLYLIELSKQCNMLVLVSHGENVVGNSGRNKIIESGLILHTNIHFILIEKWAEEK